ncbi:MAG: hypothetical protein IPP19_07705 [Verrucomicrobia bacterium]|nr:hypothetical protein [Verrucomicrobiota bacterium]
MEISSTSSAAQATEIQQALMVKKTINAEQRKVLALIESAMPQADSQDSAKVGKMLDAKA